MARTPVDRRFIVVSPFETPDAFLALAANHAGAFPVLHMGRDATYAREQLAMMRESGCEFGVAYSAPLPGVELPDSVTLLLAPWTMHPAAPAVSSTAKKVWQVVSAKQAQAAIDAGATSIALKGNESAGHVGTDSCFILFQELISTALDADVEVYIQGGVGVHTAPAYLALGATGVILDSQLALFPESHASPELARLLSKLNGQETRLISGVRVMRWLTMPRIKDGADPGEIDALTGGLDPEKNLIPLGQDFTLSTDYVNRYHHLDALIEAMEQAVVGHVNQARFNPAVRRNNELARELGTEFPVIQGPMARVSDEAEFLKCVADAGAMPMLAIGMATPESAESMLNKAQQTVTGPWGAGLLGFLPQAQFEAQAQKVLTLDPPPSAVVIAGGRAAQSAIFEKAGIKAFLHVPSAWLLDQYVKEGVHRFIFEGRESGGHVGPMYSTVLWEKQLVHLLALDDVCCLEVIFAGGIHDAMSSAFVSIMAASLSARGAKVGIVMGTAYLFTSEAVSSGAITPTFQKLALEADKTVLLESAPGQETRVLPTAFTAKFEEEKVRLEATEEDSVKRRIALEEMNLGRARVASKGLERDPQTKQLHRVDVDDQITRGEYMAGSIVPLMTRPITMRELHESVTDEAVDLLDVIAQPAWRDSPDPTGVRGPNGFRPKDEPIAIIGMAGIFPGADNVEEYWRNNLIGRDCITEVPPERWDPSIFYDPDTPDTDYVASKWGGFLAPQEFNPLEFGIAPNTIGSVEPSQLLSLLVAARALDDAGIDFKTADLTETSVIFGTEATGELASSYGSRVGLRQMTGVLPPAADETLPRLDEDSFPGILSNVTTGRIANRLNCGGRNYTVDAACASTLAALDVACLELWSDRANMVICGGADLHNSILDYAMFSATHALSKRGYCATFDQTGDGLTLGEGVGAVILKRLSDAERDGDRIYAIIRGVDGASDGRSLGLTAPNRAGQVAAMERAYLTSGVTPAAVGMIEAHGTGTAVGDRTELAALSQILLDAGALPGQVWVGSGKTQIGHTKCTAGVAGLIRVALSVRNGVVPPTLHLDKPVQAYVEGRSPVAFNASGEATVWMSEQRVAGISGFGFGGTDFHAIVQNYGTDEMDAPTMTSWDYELFLVRGATMEQARAQLDKVRTLYEVNHKIPLKDVAYTLATVSEDPVQMSIVASNWEDLLAKISLAQAGTPAPEVYYRKERDGKVGFLFPGQGSQHIDMARGLFVMFPWLRGQLEGNEHYSDIMFPPTAFTDDGKQAQQADLTDTRNAQPSLGLVDTAIADLLKACGVAPDAVAGHSYGEVAALSFAGAIDREDLAYVSRQRAEAILEAIGSDPGTMAAVSLGSDKVLELLGDEPEVWAVNFNSPQQTVIAGTTEGVERVITSMRGQGVNPARLDVACAFHTPLVAGADSLFGEVLDQVEISAPAIDVWSNTTASLYPADPDQIREQMTRQIVSPVRFADELAAMYDDGVRIFIEAGPSGVLTSLARATLGDDITTITVEHSGKRDLLSFLRALGQYGATGHRLDLGVLFRGRDPRILDLDAPHDYEVNPMTWMIDGLAAVPLEQWREDGERHPVRERLDLPEAIQSLENETHNDTKGTTMTQEPTTTTQQPAAHPVQNLPAQPMVPAAMPTSMDTMVYTYLQNVRAMLDDQRDIMLTYMGYGGTAPDAMLQAGVTQTMATAAPMQARQADDPADPADPADPVAVLEDDPVVVDDSAPVETFSLPTLDSLSEDELREIVIEVIADKTGYPAEMIGLDMDLEADLSIDSIKRLEIIGALGDRIQLPDTSDATDEEASSALEQMTSIKTLRGLVGWLINSTSEEVEGDSADVDTSVPEETPPSEPSVTIVEPVPTSVPPSVPDEPSTITRLTWIELDAPFSTEGLRDLTGRRLAVTDDGGGFAQAVSDALEKYGAQAILVDPDTPDELTDLDGLVLINASAAPIRFTIEDLFILLKKMDLTNMKWLTVFDDTLGALTESEDPDFSEIVGFSGLVKSFQHEHRDVVCTSVTGKTPFDLDVLAQMAVQELAEPVRYPDIIYSGSTRTRHTPVATDLMYDEPRELLTADDVVLVLGGAQGISPTLVEALCKDEPCQYILVGRTARDKELAQQYPNLGAADQIQRYLADHEHFDTPRELTLKARQIAKVQSIEAAVARIEATGAQADYACADVSDPDQFSALICEVRHRFGHIDAVIHAAGILEDKLFRDKTLPSFQHVYSTKVNPLRVICTELLGNLKRLVMFSSTTAAFGNAGQCDYAAGNATFDMLATILQARGSGVHAVATAWGGWKGAGMVSPTLETEMKKRGLTLIPLQKGAQFFCDELRYGHDATIMAMGGQSDVVTSYLAQALTNTIDI